MVEDRSSDNQNAGDTAKNEKDKKFPTRQHPGSGDSGDIIYRARQAEERFRLLYEQSPLAYQSLDKEGKILEVNPAWLEMLGYSKSQVTGRPFEEFLAERSRRRFKNEFSKLISKGRIKLVRLEMIRSDGSIITVEVDGRIGTEENGKFRQTHCILRDITRQKEVESRLRMLASVIDQCREGIAVSDLDGNLVFMNRFFAEMHGYNVKALLGKHLSILHTKEQIPAVEAACKQIQQEGKFKGEMWHCRVDGTVFPALMHNSLLRDKSGEAIGMIATMLDITELKEVEARLSRERDLAQKYLDIAGVIIIVIGKDKKVKMINKKGCEILGYSREEIIGRNWFEKFLLPEEKERISGVFEVLLAGDIKGGEYEENAVITKSGEKRLILWHNITLADEQGNCIGTLSSGLDITERQKADIQLRLQHSLAVALSKAGDLRTALELILDAAFKIEGIDCGGVYLFDEKTGGLDLVVHKKLSQEFVRKVSHYDRKDEQTALVLKGVSVYQTGSKFTVKSIRDDLSAEGMLGLFVIPIKYKGAVIGCFNLGSRTSSEISPSTREAVEIFAAQIGGMVARIKAEEALRHAHNELERKVEERTAQLARANREVEAESAERQLKEKMLKESEKLAQAGRIAAKFAQEINNPLSEITNSFLLVRDAVPKDYKYYEHIGRIEKKLAQVGDIVRQILELYKPQ